MDSETVKWVIRCWALFLLLGAATMFFDAYLFFSGKVVVEGIGIEPLRDFISAYGTQLAFAFIALGVAELFAVYGLWQHRQWGRIMAIVFAVFALPFIPVGIAVGALGIWLFGFQKDIKAAFAPSKG